jgi:hypothetical protein
VALRYPLTPRITPVPPAATILQVAAKLVRNVDEADIGVTLTTATSAAGLYRIDAPTTTGDMLEKFGPVETTCTPLLFELVPP